MVVYIHSSGAQHSPPWLHSIGCSVLSLTLDKDESLDVHEGFPFLCDCPVLGCSPWDRPGKRVRTCTLRCHSIRPHLFSLSSIRPHLEAGLEGAAHDPVVSSAGPVQDGEVAVEAGQVHGHRHGRHQRAAHGQLSGQLTAADVTARHQRPEVVQHQTTAEQQRHEAGVPHTERHGDVSCVGRKSHCFRWERRLTIMVACHAYFDLGRGWGSVFLSTGDPAGLRHVRDSSYGSLLSNM